MRLKISARSSHLARLQAYLVGEALLKASSNLTIEYCFRESLGDKNLTDPLWKMPEKGVFTEDFYADLVEGKTDLVVHSWKDLPVEPKKETEIVASLARADQRDILLLKKQFIGEKRLRVFTSSPRREYNLESFLQTMLPALPEAVQFQSVRGNVPTRLKKMMQDNSVHGLILAKAALDRFLASSWEGVREVQAEMRAILGECQWMVLPLSQNPNAAAQGALAIEIRRDRQDLRDLLTQINDPGVFAAVSQEREILSGFGGGCHQKIGIAILPRPYGEIQFLRGLTDQGKILNEQRIIRRAEDLADLRGLKKWSSSTMRDGFERREIPFEIPGDVTGIYISRISAWRPFAGVVWAAGIETWKKLAQLGVWVHGCAEGLGENEDPQVDELFGSRVHWAKLTHQSAMEKRYSKIQAVASYRMEWQSGFEKQLKEDLLKSELCFWTSATHFEIATQLFPEVRNKRHASGPGLTSLFLQDQMGERQAVFLNENEFLNFGE